MKSIAKYIKPYWGVILLTMLIKLLASLGELWIPSLMEVLLRKDTLSGGTGLAYFYGGLMILCAAFSLTLNILSNRMSAKSSGKITQSIRHDLFQKLQSLSSRQMDKLTVASAESRLTSDTYNVNQMFARIQRMGIRAPSLLIGGIIMMFTMDTTLALILLSILPVIAVVVIIVTKYSVPLHTKQQSVLDKVVRVVQENITGIRVIKALSKTDHEKKRFGKVNKELADVGMQAGLITGATNPISTLVIRAGLTLVVILGAFRVNSGEMEPSVIVAALQYFIMISNAMMGVTRIFIMWARGEASAKRIGEVLETPEDLLVLPAQEPEENAPHIEFRNVSFSYTGVGKNLDSLSFRLEHGQTLGILGPTGSGKSTVLNLLMRLYDADSGTVLLDGRDIRTIDPEELRAKFGVVFQNDFITAGDIGGNIRFFRALQDEALDRAAEHAQAGFIKEKEGGMKAEVVVRGNNLSGGQKQRLLIARALAADPEILVLDDSSSALDYATDAALRRALRENFRNTTTVLVAQRVSSLRHADLILVLDDGAVIGMGDHAQLMESCEEYRIIAQTQMGEGKEAAV
jgi:ATP-binding cassette subfamily B protein